MDLDLSKVLFTKHALNQFYDRYRAVHHGQELNDPEKTARKLLAKAREDDVLDSVSRVRRLIDNGFQEVSYFLKSGWRFIIKDWDGQHIVLTIERDHGRFGGQGKRRR